MTAYNIGMPHEEDDEGIFFQCLPNKICYEGDICVRPWICLCNITFRGLSVAEKN